MSNKFNVYFDDKLLKSNCKMEAMIPAGHVLTDDEVRQYYRIDEDHKDWDRVHRPAKVNRYVFDKLIVPDNSRTRLETVSGDD